MKVWLTREKTSTEDTIFMFFQKPKKIYDSFLGRYRWTFGGYGGGFYLPLSPKEVGGFVTVENSPLEVDIPMPWERTTSELADVNKFLSDIDSVAPSRSDCERIRKHTQAIRQIIADNIDGQTEKLGVFDCGGRENDAHPKACITMEDFSEGEGFFKVHLAYLSTKQVCQVEELVKSWITKGKDNGKRD